jgi:hypothetical protein
MLTFLTILLRLDLLHMIIIDNLIKVAAVGFIPTVVILNFLIIDTIIIP